MHNPDPPSLAGGQRIAGLREDEIIGETRAALQAWWPPFNIHRVLAKNLATMKVWIPFGTHILRNNLLGERRREIAVLRVAWNARSAYEWGQHAGVWLKLGFPEAELDWIVRGSSAPGWTPVERAILDATDQMMSGWKVSDEVYAVLAAELSEAALIDFVFLVGEFIIVALALNTFRIESDPWLRGLPPEPDGVG